LTVRPGDVVVVKLAEQPTSEMVAVIREQCERVFPENRATILGPGCSIGVVRVDQELAG
jgi:hypothetical protein